MLSVKERFMSRFQPVTESGCWLWMSALSTKGYGQFCTGHKGHLAAHRVSYTLFKGPIPEGKLVCHRCDVRCCVNPDHLFLGSAKENTQDCMSKGRFNSGKYQSLNNRCARGHEFDDTNSYVKADGRKRCKQCARMKKKEWRGKHAAV